MTRIVVKMALIQRLTCKIGQVVFMLRRGGRRLRSRAQASCQWRPHSEHARVELLESVVYFQLGTQRDGRLLAEVADLDAERDEGGVDCERSRQLDASLVQRISSPRRNRLLFSASPVKA